MNSNSFDSIKNQISSKYNCNAPLLFGFSLGAYEDEVQKERNRKLYLQLKELEMKLINVKNTLTGKAAEKIAKLRRSKKLK